MLLQDLWVVNKILVDLNLDFCIDHMRMFFEWRWEDNSCIQCRIPLHSDCKMAPELSLVEGEEEGGGVGVLESPIGGEGEVGGVWKGFDDEVEDE